MADLHVTCIACQCLLPVTPGRPVLSGSGRYTDTGDYIRHIPAGEK